MMDETRPRPTKRRRRSSPAEDGNAITPPASDGDYFAEDRIHNDSPKRGPPPISPTSSQEDTLLSRATHVLLTESRALAHVTALYQTSPSARAGLTAAVRAVLHTQRRGGKLITCGVGKSAYIAQKLTATCKSLGVRASFMHACEAAHGDLGDVREVRDCLAISPFPISPPAILSLDTRREERLSQAQQLERANLD